MNTADIIATCSGLIASLAFVVTVFHLRATHHHNKLSVRPLLVWNVSRFASSGGCTVTYSLRNHGLGPAIVKDRYLSKDGVRFQPPTATGFEVDAFLQSVISEKVQYRLQRHGLPGIGTAVPSQCEHVIAELFFPDMSPAQLTTMEGTLPELHFHVEYESMYKEKYTFSTLGDAKAPHTTGRS